MFTTETADRFWVRNLRYFSDFVDAACPDPKLAQAVADRVAAARSIRVHELLADTDADPDILWWLLANGRIAADLQRELCFDFDTSWVHASYEWMLAARHRPRSAPSHASRPRPVRPPRRARPRLVVGRRTVDRDQRRCRLYHSA